MYSKNIIFLGECHLYSMLFLLLSFFLIVLFLPLTSSVFVFVLFLFLICFPFYCLLYPVDLVTSVNNSQFCICLISSLHSLSLSFSHSLIFTTGSTPTFSDLAVVYILQSVSMNLNYQGHFQGCCVHVSVRILCAYFEKSP